MIYDEATNVVGAMHNAYLKGVEEERERILALGFVHEARVAPGLDDDHFGHLCVTCRNIELIKASND